MMDFLTIFMYKTLSSDGQPRVCVCVFSTINRPVLLSDGENGTGNYGVLADRRRRRRRRVFFLVLLSLTVSQPHGVVRPEMTVIDARAKTMVPFFFPLIFYFV